MFVEAAQHIFYILLIPGALRVSLIVVFFSILLSRISSTGTLLTLIILPFNMLPYLDALHYIVHSFFLFGSNMLLRPFRLQIS